MDDELVDELIRATTTVGEHYYASAALVGLGVQEARLLFILTTEPSNMLGLSSALNVPKSTLTGLIARMESAGLITRDRGEADRRHLVANPTAKGRKVATAFTAELAARVSAIVPDDPEFAGILTAVLKNAESGEG
ncbi:MAG: MarR family transcriptional regulator [Actinomycetota bacterium]